MTGPPARPPLIEDYALIGDMQTAALVSRAGSDSRRRATANCSIFPCMGFVKSSTTIPRLGDISAS